MAGIRDVSLGKFIEMAGAKTPTPGGGSIAAAGGALGVSMALMSARFTQGKKKFADVADEINAAADELEKLSSHFLDLIDRDMQAYTGVNAAYSMPKETDEEKAARKTAVAAACANAAKPPKAILDACERALKIAARLAVIANPMLLSDVGVAGEMLSAAAGSAFLNVKANADVIGGDDGKSLLDESGSILANCRGLAASIAEKLQCG